MIAFLLLFVIMVVFKVGFVWAFFFPPLVVVRFAALQKKKAIASGWLGILGPVGVEKESVPFLDSSQSPLREHSLVLREC